MASGRPLPLPHRAAWAALHQSPAASWFLAVADSTGRPCGAAAVQLAPSRALPGHRIVRCERFGPGIPVAAQRAALSALAALARDNPRILRLHVETFAIDREEHAGLERAAGDLGFVRVVPPRSYEHTLLVPLAGEESSIFASFHGTARRHIRAADRNPVRVGLVEDPAYFDRLDAISRETYARTGGAYDPPDWSKIVALGAREPLASRLVGLYRTDRSGPESLLAFAWGCGHGDHVHYSRAASTRDTDLRMPLMYPVVWDLIRWAKRTGARYFDFGGITVGSHRSDDPLGGISDFKRYFSGRVEQVGAEWSFEPRAVQAGAARFISSASSFVSGILTRSRQRVDGWRRPATESAARCPAVPGASSAPLDLVIRDGRG